MFRRWQLDGTWAAIVTALQALADTAGHVTWDVSVDSGTARAHQHAAGLLIDGTGRASSGSAVGQYAHRLPWRPPAGGRQGRR